MNLKVKIKQIWDILWGAKICHIYTVPPKASFHTAVITVDNHTDEVMGIWIETFPDRRKEKRRNVTTLGN